MSSRFAFDMSEVNTPRFIAGAKILIENDGCFESPDVHCQYEKEGALCPLAAGKYASYCASEYINCGRATSDRKVSMVKGAKLFLAEHCVDALEYLL